MCEAVEAGDVGGSVLELLGGKEDSGNAPGKIPENSQTFLENARICLGGISGISWGI